MKYAMSPNPVPWQTGSETPYWNRGCFPWSGKWFMRPEKKRFLDFGGYPHAPDRWGTGYRRDRHALGVDIRAFAQRGRLSRIAGGLRRCSTSGPSIPPCFDARTADQIPVAMSRQGFQIALARDRRRLTRRGIHPPAQYSAPTRVRAAPSPGAVPTTAR